MMKFLIDEQSPVSLAKYLITKGVTCLHIQILKTKGKVSDADIWKKSVMGKLILLSSPGSSHKKTS